MPAAVPGSGEDGGEILPGGIIVTAQGQQDSSNKVYTSTSGNAAFDLPMIVLVDADTASRRGARRGSAR